MRRIYLLFGFVCMVVVFLTAQGIQSPGYMDADYYFATGRLVADGRGFTQPFLWHYLDDPQGIPHTSHGYWLPLTTLVAALPMWLFKSTAFRIAQIPFVLLAGLLPVATVNAAYQFHGQRRWAMMSGLLALFSGFYFIFFLTTDNFILFAWIGGGVLWFAAGLSDESKLWKWGALGGLIGLAHLSRADGILLLLPVLWVAWRGEDRRGWTAIFMVLAGLVLIELPWWLRNYQVFGSILSPSTHRVLWLTTYNELFAYPADQLTMEHWLQSGVGAILQARLEALWLNLQHVLAEPGMVFLWPFVMVAARRYRQHRWVRISTGYFLLMFFVMTVVFPFAGGRGGVYHSSVAVLPLVWVLAPCGLVTSIGWAAEKRGWEKSQAQRVFLTAAILMMAALTMGLYFSQVIDPSGTGRNWDESLELYLQVGAVLENNDHQEARVAVNNPPGFWLATGMEAVVIPDGDEATLEQLVEQYEVDIVILDRNVPSRLESLFHNPQQLNWLRVIEGFQDANRDPLWIFEVIDQ